MPTVRLRIERGNQRRFIRTELPPDVAEARRAYMRDYRDTLRDCKAIGAVDGEYVQNQAGQWLFWDRPANDWVEVEPWWLEHDLEVLDGAANEISEAV